MNPLCEQLIDVLDKKQEELVNQLHENWNTLGYIAREEMLEELNRILIRITELKRRIK